ncbi:MAG: VWA domain-containing protein, partial [Deltaproteobacteria bacterium]
AIASALPVAAAVGADGTPRDPVIVRPECFEPVPQPEGYGGLPGAIGGGAYGAPVSPSPVATTGARAHRKQPKAKPGAPPPPVAAESVPAFDPSEEQLLYEFEEDTIDGDLVLDEPARPAEKKARDAGGDRRADGKGDTVVTERPTGPVLEWGARTFLSNDDSMSLASAQRVIFALQHGLPLPMEHIRPHELLNYFSFDTAEPTATQLFDVHASARRDGDQLSVAIAVKGAAPEPEPLDLTLVVDRSCSMQDEGRMDYTRRALHRMREQLRDGDRVDIVLFDDRVCTPLENFVVGRDDPALLTRTIDRIEPEGATDLDLGLREGYDVARRHRDTHHRNRRVMVITDAELNTGDVNPHTVSEIGRAFDEERIRLTGVGVGRTFRDDVLDRLTEKGKGAYVFLGSEAVVDRLFGSGFPSLVQTIAHDVRFELDLPDSLAMKRFYGEEASTVAADIQPIHYYAGTSQVFLQDLAVHPKGVRDGDPVVLTIRYRDAKTGEPEQRVFRTTVGRMLASDPHNVDKALALMAWTDLLQERAMGGDACGQALRTYAARAARLPDDAEIAFVNDLVRGLCGQFDLPTTVAAAPLKVRVDSDQPIDRVALQCPGVQATETLSGSDNVARFDAAPGTCIVTLGGVVDLRVEVEVPETGRDLRCTVRGGRVHCG